MPRTWRLWSGVPPSSSGQKREVVTAVADWARQEQTRARYPDEQGYVDRDGVSIFWERYGEGPETILLLPSWAIVHSRIWKGQIPYLARHGRVVTFDPRGNGRSDRPEESRAYSEWELVEDALAVLDATGTDQAVVVSLSLGAHRALILAAEHPERVSAAVFISCSLPLTPLLPERAESAARFDDVLESRDGWAKFNRHYWLEDYRGFLEFFFSRCLTEAHSTKQIEDAVGWGLEGSAEMLLATAEAPALDEDEAAALASQVQCPILVIHGEADAVSSVERGKRLAALTAGTLVTIEGGGHFPHARDPVLVNLLLRETLAPPPPPRRWPRARSRRRRALYVSSPIGLGHAQRDVAIARELRALVPDLEIDWLAQHPVTAVLGAEGERIHPLSAELANESGHMESESGDHELNCFQAWRRMDEILLANFMVFHDLVRDEHYDLWIGDEAWELDYYLHENPELKRAAYAWLTDFVGWLPMPDGGEEEARLTGDYNAEMIEHIARFPRVRDRAIFVGDSEDIVPDTFGPDLPAIRQWTEEHYDFAGYVTGFDPTSLHDKARLRGELGYAADEQICLVTVGGSGVGGSLLYKVSAAFPLARELVPELRMIIVAGPRIDPASITAEPGLEVRPYVHDLYRHLAACDLAVVQGGLTTTMELTANRTPFLSFPLRNHFEQNVHVRHRLERYRAGRQMDYSTSTPESIASAIAEEIGRDVDYRPVRGDGAARAAELMAELL
jgi:pimeloyl-ACP methyl ester carboxylesterase/predicted glycosyltransferase